MTRACGSARNSVSLSISSLRRPMNDSAKAFCPGLPARCNANQPCDRPPIAEWPSRPARAVVADDHPRLAALRPGGDRAHEQPGRRRSRYRRPAPGTRAYSRRIPGFLPRGSDWPIGATSTVTAVHLPIQGHFPTRFRNSAPNPPFLYPSGLHLAPVLATFLRVDAAI